MYLFLLHFVIFFMFIYSRCSRFKWEVKETNENVETIKKYTHYMENQPTVT